MILSRERPVPDAFARLARWAVAVAAWASGLAVCGCGGGDPLDRARAAYAAANWAEAERQARRASQRDPNGAEAAILTARALARQGKDGDARARFAALGGERLGGEDLFLIGQGLVRDGRAVLGWAAYDAALKLEPKHAEAVAASAELYGRLEKVPGAARAADQLTAVPGGAALAELLTGLLRVDRPATVSSGFDPLLDRLTQRDRAALARVDSPAAARTLLARILLEEGRPAEARTFLPALTDRSADPEACWLFSRVELQEGDIERASAAAERAGRFGEDTPLAHEPSRFAGAKRCAECHGAIYRAQQSSRHATTVAGGAGLKAVPLPRGDVTDPADPKVSHRFERSGATITASARVDGRAFRAVVDYALGSGHHGVTMVGHDAGGRRRSFRISYYAGGDYWGITDGFDPHPADPADFVGQPIGEPSFRTCMNCHTTRFRSEHDRTGPEAADKGIGCERCHGPGENHLKAVDAGFPGLAIARPKLATPAQRTALCGQCHAADGTIPPTDPRFIRFQATTLPYSRCVTESGGRLDCVACHDPHRNAETSPAYYEARCLACHNGGTPGGAADKRVRVDAVAASRCPVNPTTGCVSCHMPKAKDVLPFTSFTDHHIRIHHEPKGGGAGGAGP